MTPDMWVTEKHKDSTAMSFRLKQVLFSEQSPFQHVCVVETEALGKLLLNDGMTMVSEADEFVYHEMIAHVPLFAHPDPKRVLVIGGGDAGTAREVLRHKNIEKCTMVEIDEAVVRACREHIPSVSCALVDPRLSVIIDDGVKYVAQTQEKFDVILIDSTDPIGPAQPLFGEDFYKNIASCLAPGGIVVSQAESVFHGKELQESLLKILRKIFKHLYLYNYSNLTYPGGLWSFSFASQNTTPFPKELIKKIHNSHFSFRYYNPNIHYGSFALPNFQWEQFQGLLDTPAFLPSI
ncbi:MAG: polyamine aminopropyltransferase [Candidatus Brocadiae bacterium]|nr:polyamine aminopropyltransferase [Candidatus Brocadiia bacterium]